MQHSIKNIWDFHWFPGVTPCHVLMAIHSSFGSIPAYMWIPVIALDQYCLAGCHGYIIKILRSNENALGHLILWNFFQKFLRLFPFLYQNQKKSIINIFQKIFDSQFQDPVRKNLYTPGGGIKIFPIIF